MARRRKGDTVLNLRRKVPLIEFHTKEIKERIKANWQPISNVIGIFLLLILVGSFLRTHASVATFYPSSCLGGWESPENAVGEPSVSVDAKPEEYTKSNSAFIKETLASMYCGTFTGEVPKDTVPKHFKLSIKWSVDDGEVVHNETTPFDFGNNTDTQNVPTQSVDSILDGTTQIISVPDSSQKVDAPTPASEDNQTPSAVPDSESSPQSFLQSFSNTAFADEITPASDQGETAVLPTEETVASPLDTSTNNFAEITYTVDGVTWQSLGKVNYTNWKDISYDIPLNSWDDISKFQVKINTLSYLDTPPSIYLDSMNLTVEYDDVEQAPKDLPVVKIKGDDLPIISSELNSFVSDDTPIFTVTDPNLSVSAIKDLVKEGRAEVLEDSSGVLNDDPHPLGVPYNIDIPKIQNDANSIIDNIKKQVTDPTVTNDHELAPTTTTSDSNPIPDISKDQPLPDLPPAPDISAPTDATGVIVIPEDNTSSNTDNAPTPSTDQNNQTASPVDAATSFLEVKRAYASDTLPVSITDAVVLDHAGQLTDITAMIKNVNVNGVDTQQVSVSKPGREFRPGKYTLKVTMTTDNAIIIAEQDFSWGVLSINTSKSIFHPGDNAYLQMGVLNEHGHTICDADMTLVIKSPSGIETNFDTSDASIKRESQCGRDNVIEVPDYYAHYTVPSELGTYKMTLTAVTANGPKTVTDTFAVGDSQPFDVTRVGPSRIYPIPSYPMTIHVTPVVDWNGTIVEHVPASFDISQPTNSTQYDSVELSSNPDQKVQDKIISWNVTLKAGVETDLGYYFNAPDISPEFFLLGPVEFYSSTFQGAEPGLQFKESRAWQIASDGVPRFWVGGTGNWSNATAHWANSSGGAPGAGNTPTAADNCVFDTNSSTANAAYTVTVDVAATCLDFTMAGPGAGNKVTWAGASTLAISGSMSLSGGTAGITNTYSGAITFNSISGTQTISTNSVAMGSAVTFNGVGGTWQLVDAFNGSASAIAMTLTNGTLDTNGQTVSVGSFTSTNANVRTLTLGSSTINAQSWQVNTITNLTFNPGTSTISMSSIANPFQGGGLTYNAVVFAVGGQTISGTNTFATLTLTGQATKTGTFFLNANQTVTGTFNVTGNSIVNRVLVSSDVSGTARTITSAAVSLSNMDFLDIIGAGAASPFTGASIGSCGNNAGITGTTAVTRFAKTGVNANWSNTAMWSATSGGATGATVPLCHDTVIFNALSITAGAVTITSDMPRLGKSIDFTGVTNTPVFGLTSTPNTIYGSLTLVAGITLTDTQPFTIATRNSDTLTSAGKTFSNSVAVDAGGGVVTLADAFISSTLTITSGTFNANNQSVTTGVFNSSNSNTRTIVMGSGTWTITSNGAVWNTTNNFGLTFNADTSTIKFTDTSNNPVTFFGGSLTFNNIWFSRGASTGGLTIAGSNTFNDFRDNGSFAHSILFTTGSSQTVTTFTVSGSAGNIITINSTTTGTHTLVKVGGGTISSDFLNIQHSIATPASTWYAGTNSVNNQAVATAGSGWTFTAAPATCTAITTGNWNTGGNWTGCTGAFGRPAAGDVVVINPGVTITQNVNTPAVASIAIDGTLDTGANRSITTSNLYINSGGTLTANASTITLTGTSGILFTQTGTFNEGTSTVIMNGNVAFTSPNFLTSSSATTFFNLTLSPTITASRTYTFGNGAVTINGALSSNPVGGGTVRTLTTILGTGGLTVVGAVTLTGTTSGNSTLDTGSGINAPLAFASINIGTSCILNFRGSNVNITGTSGVLVTNTGTWTTPVAPSTVTLSGNGSASIFTVAALPQFYNLIVSGTGTKTLGAGIQVNGVLSLTAGTFAMSTFTMSLTGSGGTISAPFATPTGGALFSAGTGTVLYTSNNTSGNTTIESSVTYHNLQINNTSETFVPNGALNLDATGTLTLSLGTLDTTASNYDINAGKINIASAASAILNANASTITLNAITSTLFTLGALGTFNAGTSTVIMNGNAALTLTSGTFTFYNLSLLPTITVARIYTFGAGVLTINGDFSIKPSAASALALTVNPAGNIVVASGKTVLISRLSSATSRLDLRPVATDYNLTTGSISIDAGGTLDGTAYAGTITVAKDWTNAGTFTAGSSTVLMNTANTATVSGGPTTFFNLTITHTAAKEVDFSTVGTEIVHVTGLFTVTGTLGNLMKLYSTIGGTKWHFHPTGTSAVTFADVKDGGCEAGAVNINTSNSNNSGNNDSCWIIANSLTFSISANSVPLGVLSTLSANSGSHTISASTNAPGGFAVSYKGPTLTSGAFTIPVYTSSASSPGTEGFGMNLRANTVPAVGANPVTNSGSCGMASGYNTPDTYSFVSNTTTTITSVTAPADCVYTASYVGNISSTTKAGSYTSAITYIITGTF